MSWARSSIRNVLEKLDGTIGKIYDEPTRERLRASRSLFGSSGLKREGSTMIACADTAGIKP
jgi:hypothetical protein